MQYKKPVLFYIQTWTLKHLAFDVSKQNNFPNEEFLNGAAILTLYPTNANYHFNGGRQKTLMSKQLHRSELIGSVLSVT